MADLKTSLLGLTLNSPIIGASGTVGYGPEYEELADFSKRSEEHTSELQSP